MGAKSLGKAMQLSLNLGYGDHGNYNVNSHTTVLPLIGSLFLKKEEVGHFF